MSQLKQSSGRQHMPHASINKRLHRHRLYLRTLTPTVDETAPKPSVAAAKETTSRQSGPADDPVGTGLRDWLQPFEPEETDADGDPIGTSQEATAEPSTNDAKRAMAIRTVNTRREAVGLPPLKKPRVHLSRRTGESSNDPVESSILGNDDLYIDCYWSSEVPNDEILVVNKSTNTIVWSRLTENEKSLFDDAKDQALLKYINRNAWRPVKRVTSNPKKTCPIVFALKWKNGTAHARVCLQGFKHEDSTTKLLHKESPTMSRIGRSFIFLVLVHKRWKAFAADAADAFLQGMNVEDLGIDIFTDPVGDVRKRLQRLMNLAEDEVLKMLKSGVLLVCGMTKPQEICVRLVLPVILWIAVFLCLSMVVICPSQ